MPNGQWSYLSLFFSHGLTAALTLYVAVRGGDWLDRRLGTSPLFLAVLVLLVLGANLHLLIKDIMAEAEKQDRPPRGRPEQGSGQTRQVGGREEEEE